MNVLFVCTANSARSILAEAYLNHASKGAFRAYSAGSRPGGTVNAVAINLLKSKGIDTGYLRSKSWDEFSRANREPIDVVITVCDNAAKEECPYIPGVFARAHWGVTDPAAASEATRRAAFEEAFGCLKVRIDKLLALRIDGMSTSSINDPLAAIGRT